MTQAEPLGFVEWFRLGDKAHAEKAIDMMRAAGVQRLRTQFSWAEYHQGDAEEWYEWLMPKLGVAFDVMPCFHYTPPSLSRTGRSSGAPHRLRDFADFIDVILTRHGTHFEAIELWNEPNNLLDWDWRADPDHALYCEMIGDAAHWVRERGFPVVLGGPSPFDPEWLDLIGQRGSRDTTNRFTSATASAPRWSPDTVFCIGGVIRMGGTIGYSQVLVVLRSEVFIAHDKTNGAAEGDAIHHARQAFNLV